MANRFTHLRPTWTKIDGTTYKHNPSGRRVIKMDDDTWSVCTGPVEHLEIGTATWIGHKYRILRDAKQAASRRLTVS